MKTGLVLEGGAMRGLYTAGILDVLMEQQIHFDGIIGVSAGAAFGCNYKSHQIGRVIRYNTRFCRDPRYCSWRSWWKTGDLFGADFCYRELPCELDLFDGRTFEEDPTEFYLVCTDVHTGKAHYQRCMKADTEAFEWMRASASMPLVSRIVPVGGGEYLDGAMADSIPLRFFEEKGYQKNVVILTRPPGFIQKPSKALWLVRASLRKYPELLNALAKRHEHYNRTSAYVREQEQKGKVFLFQPKKPLPVKRITHDPDLLRETYSIGRKHAEERLADLKKFLAEP